MDDSLFRKLDQYEEAEFRAWARKNYVPGSPMNEVWHPVVRDECEKMNSEKEGAVTNEPVRCQFCKKEMPLKEVAYAEECADCKKELCFNCQYVIEDVVYCQSCADARVFAEGDDEEGDDAC